MFRPPIMVTCKEVIFEGILYRTPQQLTSTNNFSIVLLAESFVAKTIQSEIHE